jgi:hypothetical protein
MHSYHSFPGTHLPIFSPFQTRYTSVKGTKINSLKLQGNTVSLMEGVFDLRRMLIRPEPEHLVRRSGLEEFPKKFTIIQMEYAVFARLICAIFFYFGR